MNPLVEFIQTVKQRNPDADSALIEKAYKYAWVAHQGQKRSSGEDFFEHPFAVAHLVVHHGLCDTPSICAALLHDIAEDTTISIGEISKQFTEEIAGIVDGLTKIDKHHFASIENYQAENLRKILLATAKDPRVMIIKLCDRLHNMRTIRVFRSDKRQRIAQETLDVYAPLAEKIGLWNIKGELEDLAFAQLYPEAYEQLRNQITMSREEREHLIETLARQVVSWLTHAEVELVRVTGRAKYFYSIYKKMEKKEKSLADIHDIYGIRIIVRTVEHCYSALGVLKQQWDFIENRFKDFIEHPKPNGYKSLHANFSVDDGRIIEVQIRTRSMDYAAESGVATHWKYKGTEKDKKFDQKINWIKQFISWLKEPDTPTGSEVTIDVFKNQIIAITPQGDPIILPEGATVIDFAYAVHTSIGNHAQQAHINGVICPLTSVISSGDVVSVTTAKHITVTSLWLKSVKSLETAAKIRKVLNIGGQVPKLRKSREQATSDIMTLAQLDHLKGSPKIRIAKCCTPVRGDRIVAFYTKDKRSITVHKGDCPNQYALDQHRKIHIAWSESKEPDNVITILFADKSGMISRIVDRLYKNNVKITHIATSETPNNIKMRVEVERLDSVHTQHIISSLTAIVGVRSVHIEQVS